MMTDVSTLCYLAFIVNLIHMVREMVRSLVWAEDLVARAQARARTRMPWTTVAISVACVLCYFVAYQHADFAALWLVRAILGLTSTTLWYVLRAAAAAHPEFGAGIDPPRAQDSARQLRWGSLLYALECVVWIYAWRRLFGMP